MKFSYLLLLCIVCSTMYVQSRIISHTTSCQTECDFYRALDEKYNYSRVEVQLNDCENTIHNHTYNNLSIKLAQFYCDDKYYGNCTNFITCGAYFSDVISRQCMYPYIGIYLQDDITCDITVNYFIMDNTTDIISYDTMLTYNNDSVISSNDVYDFIEIMLILGCSAVGVFSAVFIVYWIFAYHCRDKNCYKKVC